MTVRVGVDLSVDEGLLRGWGSEQWRGLCGAMR